MPKTNVEFNLPKKIRTVALVPISGSEGEKHIPAWLRTYVKCCSGKLLPSDVDNINCTMKEAKEKVISFRWATFADFYQPANVKPWPKPWHVASSNWLGRSFSSLLFYTIVYINDVFYYLIFNTYVDELLTITSSSGPFPTESTAFMFQEFKHGKVISKDKYVIFNKGSTHNGTAHLNGKKIEMPIDVFKAAFSFAFDRLPEANSEKNLTASCNPETYTGIIWKGKWSFRRNLYTSK